MVLFTSPEDMVFGSACQLHRRAATVEAATDHLSTTGTLVTSALSYDSSPQPGDTSTAAAAAGHFTNVYLQSLQEAVK